MPENNNILRNSIRVRCQFFKLNKILIKNGTFLRFSNLFVFNESNFYKINKTKDKKKIQILITKTLFNIITCIC